MVHSMGLDELTPMGPADVVEVTQQGGCHGYSAIWSAVFIGISCCDWMARTHVCALCGQHVGQLDFAGRFE